MAVWDKKIPWSFMLLLAGAASVNVKYSDPVCAVEGSTVTLPCTFTPPKSFIQNGKEVLLRIIRVRWCVNHLICHGTIPSVYDSSSTIPNSRYKYLGDMKGNCTLQIRDIQMIDSTVFRFRMEADNTVGHFTEQSGVGVTVTEAVKMMINRSAGATEMREGDTVTLHCNSICTFHPLGVTWFKDDHSLLESGPILQLGPLTAEDSGSYTCALTTNRNTASLPYSLHVAAEEEGASHDKHLIVRVVLFTLHTVLIIIVTAIIIKRTCVCKKVAAAAENRVM